MGAVGAVADVLDVHTTNCVVEVLPVGFSITLPLTSQSPAVSEMLVMFVAVALASATALPTNTVELISSPTLPACALSFVAVPLMPIADAGAIKPLAFNAPTLAAPVTPRVPVTVSLPPTVALFVTPRDARVLAPVTPNVPPTVSLPVTVAEANVAAPLIDTVDANVALPETARFVKVIGPPTVSVPPIVSLPVTVSEPAMLARPLTFNVVALTTPLNVPFVASSFCANAALISAVVGL